MKTMSSIIILLLFTTQVHAKGFRVLDELNLTSEQIEKIEKFKVEHKEKRKAMRSSHREYREKMKELFVLLDLQVIMPKKKKLWVSVFLIMLLLGLII